MPVKSVVERPDDGRIYCDDEPLTQQSSADECDINQIVSRAKRGEDLSKLARKPMYGDFTQLPDYRSAMVMVTKAQELFMSLDAHIRERFGNDPAKLLDFCKDPANSDELVKMGLATAKPVPHPKETTTEVQNQAIADSGQNEDKPKGKSK